MKLHRIIMRVHKWLWSTVKGAGINAIIEEGFIFQSQKNERINFRIGKFTLASGINFIFNVRKNERIASPSFKNNVLPSTVIILNANKYSKPIALIESSDKGEVIVTIIVEFIIFEIGREEKYA